MTIVICALTSDGIVLAADSRQIVESAMGQWRIDSENAEKIFQINPYLGLVVIGQGTFYTNRETSPKSIRSILRLAAKDLPQDCSVKTAATFLHDKVASALQAHRAVLETEQAKLAFYIGGYSGPEAEHGELYRCEIPGEIYLERTTEDAGLVWSGQREIVDRLILGYDPRLRQLLPGDTANQVLDQLRIKSQLLINFQTMPLQDAADLAYQLVYTTIEMQRFSNGIVGMPGYAAGCGGAIDVAIVTPGEGFQWLRRKTLA